MKKIISLVLLLSLILSVFGLGVSASELNPVQTFAREQIERIAAEPDENNIWSEETSIKSEFVLYDLENVPNSYIYNLVTNGKDTGYIQIDVLDGVYSVHSYSFDGTNEVFHMLQQISQTNTPGVLSADTFGKVYYLGQSAYAIEKDGQLLDLYTDEAIAVDRKDLKKGYNEFVASMKIPQISPQASITSGSTMITNYKNFTLADMDDFKGKTIVGGHSTVVNNHCTPTAGTNVVKYYAKCRGKSALYAGSDWNTFKALYLAMDTNGVNYSFDGQWTGTYWDITHSDGYSGLLNYINARGVPTSDTYRYALGAVTGISINSIKEQIDKNHPVIMGVKSFPGSSDSSTYHSVVAFGYKSNMVILSNGWDKSYHYHNYSSLAVHEYYYIGY